MTTILPRRGTAAEWRAANPVLANGEEGYETDTGKLKKGNGTSSWTNLPYFLNRTAIEQELASVFARKGNSETVTGNWNFTGSLLVNGQPIGSTTTLDVEAVQDIVAGMLVSGGNISIAYDDDPSGKVTFTATGGDSEVMRDTLGAALVGTNGITVSPNDSADTIVLSISGLTVSQVTGLQALLDGKLSASATASTGLTRNRNATVNILSIVNGSATVFALDGTDGQPIMNDHFVRQRVDWFPGDADLSDLPAWVVVELHLNATDPVPAWALTRDGTVVSRTEENDQTFEFKWDGIGLTDESTITASSAGVDDSALAGILGTAPTVETGDTVVVPAVDFTASGAQSALYADVPAGTTRRVGFWFKTPSAWPSNGTSVFRIRLASGTVDACTMALGNTTQPGALRLSNSGNVFFYAQANNSLALSTWYWVEVTLSQNATTPVNGTVRLQVWDQNGDLVRDSGTILDTAPTPVGFGTSHDRLMFGLVSSSTTSIMEGKFRAKADITTPIGRQL